CKLQSNFIDARASSNAYSIDIALLHYITTNNESVEFHVLSIEGSDKTRIRRTNGTPHLCMTRVACGMRQKACRCGMG
uniref:hypothetical protein n=1 Tax=Candidatus Cryptobacteroides bacterium TaxID=3085639 RepID=UPI004029003F